MTKTSRSARKVHFSLPRRAKAVGINASRRAEALLREGQKRQAAEHRATVARQAAISAHSYDTMNETLDCISDVKKDLFALVSTCQQKISEYEYQRGCDDVLLANWRDAYYRERDYNEVLLKAEADLQASFCLLELSKDALATKLKDQSQDFQRVIAVAAGLRQQLDDAG
jgi:hypothetical protein